MAIKKSAVILLGLVLSLVAFNKSSAAGTKTPFSYTAYGTFEGPLNAVFPNGNADFPEGFPVFSITLQGTGTFGSTTGPITVKEWAFGGASVVSSCGPGGSGTELSYGDSYEVITFLTTGDVLLQNLVSGTQCLGSSGPPTPFNGTLFVSNVGGTGQFAHAGGNATLNFAGQYLFFGLTGNGTAGYVQHNEQGTVTTP